MSKGVARKQMDGRDLRIGIVTTRWNEAIILELQNRCTQALLDAGVQQENIMYREVSGSFELPLAAKYLIEKEQVDAVVPIGCLIKGETMHFEYISSAVSEGIMKLGLDTSVPVIFGILTCLSEEQAKKRAAQDGKDHGYEWGQTAVEMALLKKE